MMPAMRVVTIGGALALAAVASGCGGSGGVADGAAGTVPCDGGCWHPTPADEDFAASFCGLTGPCCARNDVQPDAGAQTYADLCKAKILRAGFSRDSSLRAACLSDLRDVAGTDACLPDYSDLSTACMRLFYEPSGPRAPGQACTTAADCAGRAHAVTICEHLANSSVCMTVTAGSAGSHPCLGDVTGTGLIEISPYISGAGGAGGSAMTQAFTGTFCPTTAGLYCSFDPDPAKANICTPFSSDGSACLYPRTCVSGSCLTADGSQNNGQHPGVCGPTPTPADLPAGSPCAVDRDCASGDCGNQSLCLALPRAQKLAQLGLCTAI
jgi:hypothetical protein